jgi:hypothetical protein
LADSGSSETVCAPHHFPGSPEERAPLIKLRTATGKIVESDALKTVRLRTLKESQSVVVRFRIVKGLTQPILSVSKLNESGKEVVLGNGYAYIKKQGSAMTSGAPII